ncbi:MAG: hypothetical protein HYY16_01975 [Planctomycetes bacterium]|nr:hypothetical protein [Planctomycetota bacterium]
MRVTVAVALLASSWAYAQEVKLEARPNSVGDRAEIRIESTLDLDINIKDSEPDRTLQITQVRTDRLTQEVTAVQDGAGLVLKVNCTASEVERAQTNLPRQRETTAIHGQTFVVKRTLGTPTVVEMADGSPPVNGAETLGGWEDFVLLLPDKEVLVGEEWEVTKSISSLLSVANMAETKTVSLVASLESVQESKALIVLRGEFEGKARDGASIRVSITDGKMSFDVTRGRPIFIEIKGELEAMKDVVHLYNKPGTPVKIPEKIGEIKTKSRKLEVRIDFETP